MFYDMLISVSACTYPKSIFFFFLTYLVYVFFFSFFLAQRLSYTREVTGFLRAGTAAPWQWSNPPGRTEGTQKCAFHRAPASSTAASVHEARLGSLERRASCSPSPPAPALHGCSCLKGAGGGRQGCQYRSGTGNLICKKTYMKYDNK